MIRALNEVRVQASQRSEESSGKNNCKGPKAGIQALQESQPDYSEVNDRRMVAMGSGSSQGTDYAGP